MGQFGNFMKKVVRAGEDILTGGAATARENTDKTIAANKQLAEYQYSKDLESWNMGNAYNSPSAQMSRLEKAGLNPNLVYGNGSVTGNTTSSTIPKYSAPTVRYDYQPVNPTNAISIYQDLVQKSAVIDNLKADQENKRAQNILILANALGKQNQNFWEYGIDSEGNYNKSFGAGMAAALKNKMLENQVGISSYSRQLMERTLNDQVLKLRLGNRQTKENISSIIAGRDLTHAEKKLKEMELDWYAPLKGVDAGSKIINALLMGSRMFR